MSEGTTSQIILYYNIIKLQTIEANVFFYSSQVGEITAHMSLISIENVYTETINTMPSVFRIL